MTNIEILVSLFAIGVCIYLYFSSIRNSSVKEFKSKHRIQSVHIDDDKLTVNGENIDISRFKGNPLNVSQVNGKLEVNGWHYDFDKKEFYQPNLITIYPLGSKK